MVEVAADAVNTAVLHGWVVDGHDDEVWPAIAAEVRDGDSGPLVFPREPGHVVPRGPSPGDLPVGVQVAADAVSCGIELSRVVDHEDDDVAPTVPVAVSDCDPGALGVP
ncbi:MAG TPA: hypothetical protein VGL46_06280 [Pseudonocardiaceae bacterium]